MPLDNIWALWERFSHLIVTPLMIFQSIFKNTLTFEFLDSVIIKFLDTKEQEIWGTMITHILLQNKQSPVYFEIRAMDLLHWYLHYVPFAQSCLVLLKVSKKHASMQILTYRNLRGVACIRLEVKSREYWTSSWSRSQMGPVDRSPRHMYVRNRI